MDLLWFPGRVSCGLLLPGNELSQAAGRPARDVPPGNTRVARVGPPVSDSRGWCQVSSGGEVNSQDTLVDGVRS